MARSDPAAVSGRAPIALTIAGSDSGAGAGVQADLKTFAALGVYGASVITAVTAQNTKGVLAVHPVPPDMARAQIAAVLDDFDVTAIKIGMLANAQVAAAVAGSLLPQGEGGPKGRMRAPAPVRRPAPPTPLPEGEARPFIVYDPVLAASSGDLLSRPGLIEAVRAHLLPGVDCLTPNLPEAAELLDVSLARTEADMAEQGRALLALGPRAVLMKGGHLPGDEAVDLLVTADGARRFAAPKFASPNTHGTGCTLSSAIAAYRVRGLMLDEAVAAAKAFVREAIERGAPVRLGGGPGPLLQTPLVALPPAPRQEPG
jgi:hydroxymethylpyrimidine/phosphomethylpyrimidine kinase